MQASGQVIACFKKSVRLLVSAQYRSPGHRHLKLKMGSTDIRDLSRKPKQDTHNATQPSATQIYIDHAGSLRELYDLESQRTIGINREPLQVTVGPV